MMGGISAGKRNGLITGNTPRKGVRPAELRFHLPACRSFIRTRRSARSG